MWYHSPPRLSPSASRFLIFLNLAVADWQVVSAGVGMHPAAGEITSRSDQYARLSESLSPRHRVLSSSDPRVGSDATVPIRGEDAFLAVNYKANQVEPSTGTSSKRRRIISYHVIPYSPRGAGKNEPSWIATGSESSRMEVDGMRQRKSRPQEALAGLENLQQAFGGNAKLVADIEGSGIFKITRRLLDLITYHDLDDRVLVEEDRETLEHALDGSMLPSDVDLFGRRIFWEDLDVDKKPQIQGSAEAFARQLQLHENKINQKLLGILVHDASGRLGDNAIKVLEISKQYSEFLDSVEKRLIFKPDSFIEQLARQKGNPNEPWRGANR